VVKAISTLLVLLGKSLSLIMNLEYFDMAWLILSTKSKKTGNFAQYILLVWIGQPHSHSD
jgi:hypothetical protein